MDTKKRAVGFAILAALCYGVSAPVSKLLLREIEPALMAALLYLGAGLGMTLVNAFRGRQARKKEAGIARKDLPYVVAMILLDIAAPVLLMFGLASTGPATVSLLNNFEIVATTVIALAVFKEAVGKRMWAAIALITAASVVLSVEDFSSLSFSGSAVLVLLASICWGIENNCTRMLSLKDPLQIVVIKGFGSGLGALAIALGAGERLGGAAFVALALLLGFVAYGLSIYCYILAQRQLGAARTSACYAFAPFIGVGLSFLVFWEKPSLSFVAALAIMTAGAYLAAFEKHVHAHTHAPARHEHRHRHDDGHHTHSHAFATDGEHSHFHEHEPLRHVHAHTPDMHHAHRHG